MARKSLTTPITGLRTVPKQPTKTGVMLSKRSIEMVERKYQVVELRKQGLTVREIAMQLQCSEQTVRADLVEVLERAIRETAETTEEERQLQAERLDMLLKEFLPQSLSSEYMDADGQTKVLPGSLSAAAMVLAIEQRRAKLKALDVPENKGTDLTGIREYVGVDMDQI